jgi:hypothetical protein
MKGNGKIRGPSARGAKRRIWEKYGMGRKTIIALAALASGFIFIACSMAVDRSG